MRYLIQPIENDSEIKDGISISNEKNKNLKKINLAKIKLKEEIPF